MTAGPGKVLVVDDNDAGRYVKRRILEQAGHSVTEAREGFEALRIIVATKPEVVVLDVKLPDIKGTELCRKLRDNGVGVCVLMTSAAFVDPADRVASLESGADAYLIEPFDSTELVAAVGALLRVSRAEGNLRTINATLAEKITESTRELAAVATDLELEKENSARAEEALWHTQKLEAIGRLTGGIAHDFNNLLTVVLGNLEILEHGLRDVPGNEKWLRHIRSGRRAASDCADIVRQLLVFARRDGLRSEAIDINKSLARLEDFIRRSVGEQVTVELALSQQPAVCKIDPTHFEAAVLNLAINARDAMPKGGNLRIAVETLSIALGRAVDRTAVDKTGAPLPADILPGDYVVVSVADTGVGMSPDIASRVFEPFFTTKDIGKGSGLGLSQVFGFIKQSGGYIAVDSAPGQGARFGLFLPLSDARAATREPLDAVGAMPRGSGTILVVEDNDLVLDYVVATTTELGYRVLRATSGMEALEVIERGEPINLLFTDVVMPNGMSGIDLAREVRQRRPDVKVLITSGYSNRTTDGAGDAEFMSLVKPYSSADLAKRLREALGG
jgi:signal transduction histidine kinase